VIEVATKRVENELHVPSQQELLRRLQAAGLLIGRGNETLNLHGATFAPEDKFLADFFDRLTARMANAKSVHDIYEAWRSSVMDLPDGKASEFNARVSKKVLDVIIPQDVKGKVEEIFAYEQRKLISAMMELSRLETTKPN
jgi:hypothetical protein